MDYEKTKEAIQTFRFIEDEWTADAAIKAVLGMFTIRLHEKPAHYFTDRLPAPLTYNNLHGQQAGPRNISFDNYVRELERQFCLTDGEAKMLINEILFNVKKDIPPEQLRKIEKDLPDDWARFFRNI